MEDLIRKYNVPVPRYTSYPTVPSWKEQTMDHRQWMRQVKQIFQQSNDQKGISLYLHLPFCESLCTYCGCNKRITKNHRVEAPYVDSLLHEWQSYQDLFQETPRIRELHLGGGTPTFFQPENLKKLIENMLENCHLHPDYNFGFEGSPNNTTTEHLMTLHSLGFKRVSLGVQDFDPKVQRAVNRIHSFLQVQKVVETARSIGYNSINLDLIYGLPFQTEQSMHDTMELIGQLSPDRIAFYSYAHVPWKSPSQRGYSEKDLPKDSEKRKLYQIGKNRLLDMGYVDIGMDHFALETDAIAVAHKNQTLHRNFMGYTVSQTDLLIGLGVSAISDIKTAYGQNEKVVEKYQQQISDQGLALYRGHFLTEQDQMVRDTILHLICHEYANLDDQMINTLNGGGWEILEIMQKEGLVELTGSSVQVTEAGKAFIRNICSVFDQYLQPQGKAEQQVFSKAI